MELVKIGKNTKPTALKISGEIKTTFAKYLKAQQVLNAEEYKEVKVETLFASWLATFAESEEYKTAITAAAEKVKAERDAADEEKRERQAKAAEEKQKKLEEKLAKAKKAAEEIQAQIDKANAPETTEE